MANAVASTSTFFGRNEFLIRRLHSLSGLVPVGAYMVVHLLTNASLLNGVATFQRAVNQIHSLGVVLPVIEWLFIFLPILFHGIVGVWIIRSGQSNLDRYRYVNNARYSWQRLTGYIAFLFIFVHVFHLHGWFHFEPWLRYVAEPLGMAQFRPYSAASTLAVALDGIVWPVFYVIGMLGCVFHLANGVWTFGITWGIWVSPKAQERASYASAAFGVLLGIVGLSALYGARSVDPAAAREVEDKIYEARINSGEIDPTPEKRAGYSHSSESE